MKRVLASIIAFPFVCMAVIATFGLFVAARIRGENIQLKELFAFVVDIYDSFVGSILNDK